MRDVEKSHQRLVVWQEAMELVGSVYRETGVFPKHEIFGLTAQVRRSAVSVPSNIAEGAARNSSRELYHFLGIAAGSLAELRTQLDIAERLGFLEGASESLRRADNVARLLVSLRKRIRSKLEKAGP